MKKPVHKVRSEVGRYRLLKKKNPQLRIGVGGCVGQQEKAKLLKEIPLLDFVFGTDAIDRLPEIIDDCYKGEDEPVVSAKFEYQKPYQVQTLVRNPGISTFVNITKGCDNFCTFCVVPFTRGRERSRKLQEIIFDIQQLVKRGVKEVTLLGQNVNSYKSECGANFANLLSAVAQDTEIERIRYTTSHPKDFDEELIETMYKNRSKICDFIHLPVQSGNSEILQRMNRGHTREQYLDKVQMIYEKLPGAILSTDIIVGFPGETEEQFMDTYSLLEEVRYEKIYAFKYSPRPYTKAARYEDQLTEKEKSVRLLKLLEKQNAIYSSRVKTYEGKTLNVLVEEFQEETGWSRGRSFQNSFVRFKGNATMVGQIFPIKIEKATPQVLTGVLVE